jgi:SAM-dependent methyltransferase
LGFDSPLQLCALTLASIDKSPGRTKFGEDAALYDLARPGYPAALFDWLAGAANLNASSACFEIGSGTGHATIPILALPVRSVLAIEPDPNLAARLREKAGGDARLTVAVERFESVALEPAVFDFGFAATAFHWLPRMKSLEKAYGALKPGGRFAMWWHVFHDPSRPDAFDRAMAGLFEGLEQDPQATAGRPAFALDTASRLGELRAAGFVDATHRLFSETLTFTPDQLAGLYGTLSRVRMAPEVKRENLLEAVRRIATDSFGGAVPRTVISSAYIARKV